MVGYREWLLHLLFQFIPLISLEVFFLNSVQTGYVVVFSVREIWWEEGQKDVPVVGVVVAGYVALPGDGGHGSLPGDCFGIHCVGCMSYLEHCIIQLNSEFFDVIHLYAPWLFVYVVCVTV